MKQPLDWFPTLDPSWQNLIGATSVELTTETIECHCTELDAAGNLQEVPLPAGASCSDFPPSPNGGIICGEQTAYTVHIERTPSDGFILAESAMEAPGRTPAYEPLVMPGSGHMQMRNDVNMADAIEAIFKDGLGGNYFKTDVR